MLPDWHKNREYINIILALLLQSDPNLARLPIHIYAHSDKFLHSLNEDQKHFVEKLIEQKRFTLNFASIFSSFDSLAEDSEYRRTHEKNPNYDQAPFWVRLDDLREDICVNLIKYALTVEIQKLLNSHKCYGGMIDGWFSDRTKQAVRRFQKLHDLEEGVLNRQTWMLLKKGT
jgi:hypothetical protein